MPGDSGPRSYEAEAVAIVRARRRGDQRAAERVYEPIPLPDFPLLIGSLADMVSAVADVAARQAGHPDAGAYAGALIEEILTAPGEDPAGRQPAPDDTSDQAVHEARLDAVTAFGCAMRGQLADSQDLLRAAFLANPYACNMIVSALFELLGEQLAARQIDPARWAEEQRARLTGQQPD